MSAREVTARPQLMRTSSVQLTSRQDVFTLRSNQRTVPSSPQERKLCGSPGTVNTCRRSEGRSVANQRMRSAHLVHRAVVTVEAGGGGLLVRPGQVRVQQQPVPRRGHHAAVARLRQELRHRSLYGVVRFVMTSLGWLHSHSAYLGGEDVCPVRSVEVCDGCPGVGVGHHQLVVVRAGQEEGAGGVPGQGVDTSLQQRTEHSTEKVRWGG